MMRDPITDAAQDPSCRLCLTPDRGGSWWSRLRPHTLRNFAGSPETWTVFLQKFSEIALDDCEINLKLVPLQISSAGVFWGIYFSSNNTQLVVNSGTLTDNPLAVLLTPSVNEPVSIVIKRVGNSVEILSNEVSKGKRSGNAIDLSTAELGNARSEFNGYLLNASLTNLTTGETVWQAAYSELYDMSNPWPSSVPENFAENAKAFYDCQAVVQEALDPTHDYSFLIEAEIVRENPECSIFYAGDNKFPFGVYAYSDNTIRVFSNLLRSASDTSSTYATAVVYSGDTLLQGRHIIEVIIEGDTMRVFLDDNEIEHPYTFARTGTSTIGLPQCNSGYLYKIQITDLTDNRVIWSYPSETERVQLLTKTNVRTDRGVFEAADTSKRWNVTTRLRAESLLPKCTIIVEVDNPNGETTTFVSCAQRLNPSQGFFVIRKQDVGELLFGYSGKNSSGAMVYPNRYIRYPDGKHVFAFVLDYSALQLRIYIDGAEVDNRAMDVNVVAPPEFDETVKPVILGVTSTGDGLNLTSKISHCLIFDRALSAAEIAALTPKQA